MKTYFRLLLFTKPYSAYLPQYLTFYPLMVILGTLNFTLLIPLFDVLFSQNSLPTVLPLKPSFSFSIEYGKQMFNYYLYSTLITQGREATLWLVCSIVMTSVVLTNLFRYLSALTLNRLRANVVRQLRNKLFDKYINLHIGYFSNERKGELISRIITDIQQVEFSVAEVFGAFFKGPIAIIVCFTILFSISTKLTLFTILFLPISGFGIAEITKRLKKQGSQTQDLLGEILVNIEEALSGIKIIQGFRAENYIQNRFQQKTTAYFWAFRALGNKVDIASPLSEVMGVAIVVGILVYGGNLVLNNNSDLSPSQFVTYLIVFSQLIPPMKEISIAISAIQRGIAAGERIFSVLDEKNYISDTEDAKKLETFQESISFEDVSFSYDGEKEVLQNISFTIPKGKIYALVGTSGGGKSTLVDLVPRFYDVTNGSIKIDGEDLRKYTIDSLREKISIVTQESILFNDTIFNNIAFGIPNVSEEAVIEAAKVANAHDFIMQTEQGYQTNIGDRGSKLSGGQRQRISIARAVLRNTPILILDEATSALDTESEKLVQSALNNLMKDRTSIVIAHRLSTIYHADCILVLSGGKIVEMGNHEELMQRDDSIYKKLNEMQHF